MTKDNIIETENEETLKQKNEKMNFAIGKVTEKAISNILNELKFKTEVDKMIFNSLPLSERQKEKIVLSILNDK